jgi:hypothetical protein
LSEGQRKKEQGCFTPKPHLHRFAPGPREDDGVGTTCMRFADHEGPHRFVRNDKNFLRFKESDEE